MVDRMWQMSWSWSSFSWGVCDGEWECREGVVGEDGERG